MRGQLAPFCTSHRQEIVSLPSSFQHYFFRGRVRPSIMPPHPDFSDWMTSQATVTRRTTFQTRVRLASRRTGRYVCGITTRPSHLLSAHSSRTPLRAGHLPTNISRVDHKMMLRVKYASDSIVCDTSRILTHTCHEVHGVSPCQQTPVLLTSVEKSRGGLNRYVALAS